MLDIMQDRFHEPTFDANTHLLKYKAILDPDWERLRERDGLFQHGSRVECLKSIIKDGFRNRIEDSTDSRLWGGRTQGKRNGVYMFKTEHSDGVGNGYSQYTHLFGDGLFFSVCFLLIGDYDKRITPSERKQVVIPSEHVCIAELHMHVAHYAGIREGASVVPVWIPELEA